MSTTAPIRLNARLRDLSLKTATHVLRELNSWDTDRVRDAIKTHDREETVFDAGVAQFLRLYLGARTIGVMSAEANHSRAPNRGSTAP